VAERLLEAEGIDVRFNGRIVLTHVSVSVHAGEIVSLIGPNGAGKTTLVRVVLGLLPASHGRVTAKPGLRIGYMPQSLAVDEILPLTASRFLELSGIRDRGRIAKVLSEVGAAEVAGAQLHDLSGGELRRVILARALLREPELLVLDEPVQGVDVVGQSELYDLITGLRDRKRCGILMVSHDLHIVMAATDKVVCINHHVCCTGRPEAVSRHPEYLALFGPFAAQRLALYTHGHDHRHDDHGDVVPLAAPDRPRESDPHG
jgi:zinc transport system ATP-binding protein